MDWENLKILDAIAKTGSFSGAARKLGLDHSSVSRRMRKLEKEHQLKIFERKSKGLQLTVQAAYLVQYTQDMANTASHIERFLSASDDALNGPLRIATLDSTARTYMSVFQEFSEHYPDIELELTLSQSLANLNMNEADIVLRATNNPPETHIGRKLGRHQFAVYGSAKKLKNEWKNKPLHSLSWVGYSGGFTDDWMKEEYPNINFTIRVNTALGVVEAIRSGLGIGHIALSVGEEDKDFERLLPAQKSLSMDFWLLYHQDLRQSKKVRAFSEFVGDKIKSRQQTTLDVYLESSTNQ